MAKKRGRLGQGFYADANLPGAMSKKVVELLDAAIDRTKANKRKTVRAEDL